MREKIQRFMIGRYGADELAKAQSIAALVLLFLSMFSRVGIFYWQNKKCTFRSIGHI